ncbi:MAG: sulfatase-like hydrolase/transferase [Armatimonadota bacterium]|nr:MAG: sulfatase-like hydrolase/transferase [Armatimonadota bacterium]
MSCEAGKQEAAERPNIVFILSDQQRWDTLGCYGQQMEITPNLDRLAREGVQFEHAFTCQPVCGPARSCLQTGRYATETGCFQNDIALPEGERTIAHWLSQAGYEVGYIGKWHLGASRLPNSNGETAGPGWVPPERRGGYRDHWLASDVLEFTSHSYDGHMFEADGSRREFPPGRYRVDAQTDWVIEYLRTRTGERPFLLVVSYLEPHHQNDHRHFEGPRGSKERFAEFAAPGDLADAAGDWREELPDYLGCCHSLDENVGRIRAEVERLGLGEETLVVYTSDHGCHFRTRNSEYKRSCHDSSLRVPLVVWGPGFRGRRIIGELVSLIDLPPTVLRAAGVEAPGYMRGRPLQELVEGTAGDWPQEVFAQISESHCGRAIRTKRWKYSVRAPDESAHPLLRDSEVYAEDFLYDLEKDPHEKDNLVRAPSLAAVRAELREALKRRMVEAGEEEPKIRPAG